MSDGSPVTENAVVPELNEREKRALLYLSPLMEANSRMIGEHLVGQPAGSCRSIPAVGSAAVRGLHSKGLIYRISELNAWRLTAAGRALVREFR